MKTLMENWRRFKEEALLQEEFFFVSDKEFEKPLSNVLIKTLQDKLPGSKSAQGAGELKASGAEGIVLSLDDKRVIKMFHSLDNAAKNLPLVSKNMPQTAQVYSTGKIVLDQPAIYFKKGSSYSPEDAVPTDEIYYIVMQRVIPDPYIYRYVELAFESFNRLSNIDFNKLLEFYSIDNADLKGRINEIFLSFMKEAGNDQFSSVEDLLQNGTKKQKNILTQEFNKYRKSKTKEFVLPTNLKKLLLNYLGIHSDVPYATEVIDFLRSHPSFQRKPKKSFSGDTLAEDMDSILNLIKEIIVDQKTPWNDIHQEQFGRAGDNKLVALDLGVKGDDDTKAAGHAFNKNVSRLATKGSEIKALQESGEKIKTLNIFDFDKTLFFTHDDKEGKKKYEEVFGEEYPHVGWFGREESLSDALEIEENKQMRAIYDTLKSEPNSLSILISNRIFKLEDRLRSFLGERGYNLDQILLKSGAKTKVERLEKVWDENPEVTTINIFDDLDDAVAEYQDFKELYSVWRDDAQINIYQVLPTSIEEV